VTSNRDIPAQGITLYKQGLARNGHFPSQGARRGIPGKAL
jgi:hypothetical protein